MEVWALKRRYIPPWPWRTSWSNELPGENILFNGNLGYSPCSCCCIEQLAALASTRVCLKLGGWKLEVLSCLTTVHELREHRAGDETLPISNGNLGFYDTAAFSSTASLCNTREPQTLPAVLGGLRHGFEGTAQLMGPRHSCHRHQHTGLTPLVQRTLVDQFCTEQCWLIREQSQQRCFYKPLDGT